VDVPLGIKEALCKISALQAFLVGQNGESYIVAPVNPPKSFLTQ
jgi:hypothetical protein